MFKRLIFIDSQKVIIVMAFYLSLFANSIFFTKMYELAIADENKIALFISPFVLFLLFMIVLNIIAIFTQRYLLKPIFILLFVVSAFSSYFMNSFSVVIDKAMIANAMQTDMAEALDLFTFRLVIYVVLLGIVPIYILVKYKINYKNLYVETLNKLFSIAILFLLLGGLYAFFSKDFIPFMRNHKNIVWYLNPSYPITSAIRYVKAQIDVDKKVIKIALDAKMQESKRKKLYVIVVGETARAKNFSLNGYERETNPLLKNQTDVFALQNFYSCGTATATSLPCMFSKFPKSLYDDDKRYYENLVDILNRVGVRVIWRDNNSGRSKDVAARINDVAYYDDVDFDEILFKDLQQDIDSSYGDTLVVLHQEGSHGPTYYKRYPDEFEKFKPTCKTQDLQKCTNEEIVNTYDNTILYTDYILDKSIKLLKNNESKYDTLMMYVSDHGESLGENGIYLHSMPYFIAPSEQIHIPAIFYFGSGMKKEEDAVRDNLYAKYSHDNIFHTFLALFGVSTEEYDKNLDIFAK